MSPDVENRIFDRFRGLFEDEDGNQSCSVIEVGDGWETVITNFLEAAEKHMGVVAENDPELADFRVIEIKEKYGSLRIYTTYGDDVIFDLGQKASSDSEKICELSGQEGSLHEKMGFVKTLAPDVAAQHGYEAITHGD
ncbi:hypothetical protein [Sulfitobacter sp. R18_1]|uniref:hypothetical protein n=1 Tax=Sulfitobacter sp. R18_1 TaxID=2821104 RepID=UPI001ADAA26F|nr:hypothetical protein [Sulfitobacter sp. R18_1]MBO9428472.1 hypothetical protein [Sulfitobacter sp. R18_1]